MDCSIVTKNIKDCPQDSLNVEDYFNFDIMDELNIEDYAHIMYSENNNIIKSLI